MHSVFKIFLILLFPLYGIGTQFLVLPVNAEELSLGNHPTILGIKSGNPALYSAPELHPDFSVSRGLWLGDVTLTHLSYAQVLKSKKIFHISAKYSGISDLEFRESVPQDDAFSTFSSYGTLLKSGLSIQRENQKFGVSLSFISMGLYTDVSSGLGLNLGYALNLKNGFTFGATIKNLGKMSELSSGSPILPICVSGGLSKGIIFNEYRNTLYGSADWNQVSDAVKVYLGNQFRWNQLSIMSGFSSSKNVVETSGGFGLQISRYQITYGIKFGSQNLGIPQTISFQFQLP
ncbi:hypothetical protein OAR31_01075 [Candidatus Marinimicrobia bacterium]|nr:hypothetical protein [Candidatus Neomarinimicrobiota bacterium]